VQKSLDSIGQAVLLDMDILLHAGINDLFIENEETAVPTLQLSCIKGYSMDFGPFINLFPYIID
jgi:hypothetical protein